MGRHRSRGVASRCAPLLALSFAALGCAPVEVPPKLAGASIRRAWLEEYNWSTMGVLGGGLTGHAWLYAVDSEGGYHEQYVRLRGGLAGFGLEFTMGGDRLVELELPPGEVTGAQLFDRYSGSFEAFVVGIGFASLHLENEHGVQIDDHGLVGPLMAISVSAAWMRLVPADPPPELDSGDSRRRAITWRPGTRVRRATAARPARSATASLRARQVTPGRVARGLLMDRPSFHRGVSMRASIPFLALLVACFEPADTGEYCQAVELPPCPAECPADYFESCGQPCDVEGEACGNEIGDGMVCLDGVWSCAVHAPLGTGCNWVCDPNL